MAPDTLIVMVALGNDRTTPVRQNMGPWDEAVQSVFQCARAVLKQEWERVKRVE